MSDMGIDINYLINRPEGVYPNLHKFNLCLLNNKLYCDISGKFFNVYADSERNNLVAKVIICGKPLERRKI